MAVKAAVATGAAARGGGREVELSVEEGVKMAVARSGGSRAAAARAAAKRVAWRAAAVAARKCRRLAAGCRLSHFHPRHVRLIGIELRLSACAQQACSS